jgi:diadenosine tetraphosphatase ApaH/serine/threonine PP2A family protein phosphatase
LPSQVSGSALLPWRWLTTLTTEGCTVTVVGDTHGQLDDLFTIFSIRGLPTPENMYLFNGDFVDRGAHGCEVLATLFALKVLYPSAVFLNRGNHEARAQNAWMGFEEEILAKYTLPEVTMEDDRRAALRVHILCEQVFDALPLAAVIHGKVFVCHGGLFRNDGVTMGHLKAISRKREPPLAGKSFEDRVLEDLIWSDPRPTPSYPRNLVGRRVSDRGAGCEFGPAITSAFCNNNGFALVGAAGGGGRA